VNAADSGKVSSGVRLVTSTGATGIGTSVAGDASLPNATITTWDASHWCVALSDPTGGSTKTFKYSAQNGLETGQCSATNGP